MDQTFAVIILGGTGQVGGAAVTELLAIPACREVVMITRKAVAARPKVRNVVLDTEAADLADRVAAVARETMASGPVSAVSCAGIGSGSFIVGNANSPGWSVWLGHLLPGSFGNIDQQILGRAIAAEVALHNRDVGEVVRENAAMKALAARLS